MYRINSAVKLLACLTFALPLLADDDPAKTSDVTVKVSAEVKDNKLSITANNDLFGDPAEGEVKKLRIEYTLGGETLKKVVTENAPVEIAGADDKKLVIKKAVYGVLSDALDGAPAVDGQKATVTQKITDAIKDGKISLEVNNDNMGGDPAVGTGKQLQVEYTVGSAAHSTSVNEGDTLTLPAANDGNGALVIKKAVYGVFN